MYIHSAKRTAFTLVEMLIVLFIIVAVAAIFIPVVLNLTDRNQVPKGASMLENALHLAKSRAVAEKKPNGIRLMAAPGNLRNTASTPSAGFAWYDEIQYIEDPGDYVEHWVWGLADAGIQNVAQPWWSIRRGASTIGPAAPSPGVPPLGVDSINVLAGPITIPSAVISTNETSSLAVLQANRIVNRNRLLFGPISFADWVGVNPLPKPFINPNTGLPDVVLASDTYRSQRFVHNFAANVPATVMVGDRVEILGTGEIYTIVALSLGGVNISTGVAAQVSVLELDRPLTNNVIPPINGRPNYRIIRRPRAIPSLPPMKLPQDVVIDLTPSRVNFPSAGTGSDTDTSNTIYMSGISAGISTTAITGITTTNPGLVAPDYIDIMFSPSGEVMPTSQSFRSGVAAPVTGAFSIGSSGLIALWLHQRGDPNLWAARQITAAQGNADNQAIVAINARTGFIGSYPVDRSTVPLDPLANARLGKARTSADTGP